MNQVSQAGWHVGRRIDAPRPMPIPLPRDAARKGLIASVVVEAEQLATVDELADSSYAAAVRLYERERWSRAFQQFAALADEGHAPAAKLALLMLRHSNNLYGASFLAQPAQVARWARYVLGRSHRTIRSHLA